MTKRTKYLPIKFIFFVTCLSIGGLIYYDVHQQGNWQKSQVRKFLRDSEISTYTERLYNGLQSGFSQLNDYFDRNFPTYKRTVCEFLEPYTELSGNLGCIFYNIFVDMKDGAIETYPFVIQSFETYAPTIMEQLQSTFSNIWSALTFYVNKSIDYMKEEVFIGPLSPENIQKVMIEVFNKTQNKTIEYYHWLYEKVQSII